MTTALLVTGCSSTSGDAPDSQSATTTSAAQSAVAYSRCMRANGIPDFPDPVSGGPVPKVGAEQLGVSASQLQGAQSACRSVYPTNGGSLANSLRQCEETGDCPENVVTKVMTQLRKFSQCMRTEGLAKWPDPVLDAEGRPEIYIRPWIDGFDPESPQVSNQMMHCQARENPQVPAPLAVYLPPTGTGS
jgi:hypothetical protein